MDTKCNVADIVIIEIKLRGYGKNMTINEAGERYNIPIHILSYKAEGQRFSVSRIVIIY